MTFAEEVLERLKKRFPDVDRSDAPIQPYLTLKVPAPRTADVAAALKEEGFNYLDMVTATDWKGPVDLQGYVREPNPNPFLPEGATPEIDPPVANPKVAYKDVFAAAYLLSHLDRKEKIAFKTEVPRSDPFLPSLTNLFKAADWQEREAFDLFGIRFEGHPNLTKILTPEFTQGHPLRKDYVHVKDKYD